MLLRYLPVAQTPVESGTDYLQVPELLSFNGIPCPILIAAAS